MSELYYLSGISNTSLGSTSVVSPDVIDDQIESMKRFCIALDQLGDKKEAMIAKSVILYFDDQNMKEAVIKNALENSRFASAYKTFANSLKSCNCLGSIGAMLGDISSSKMTFSPNGTIHRSLAGIGNITVPNDAETKRMLLYFADYYTRKGSKVAANTTFYKMLADPTLINRATTEMLKKSSSNPSMYSLPYRIAYQEYIQYDNSKLLADAQRLGVPDFKRGESMPLSTQNNTRDMNQELMLKENGTTPTSSATREFTSNVTTQTASLPPEEQSFMDKAKVFFDQNKNTFIIAAVGLVLIISGYILFKPKKKKRRARSLSGVRRKRRKTTRRRRKSTTTAKRSSPTRTTTRRRKRRTAVLGATRRKKRRTTAKRKTTTSSTARKRTTRRKTTRRKSPLRVSARRGKAVATKRKTTRRRSTARKRA